MKALIGEIRKRGIGEVREGLSMRELTSFRIGGPFPLLIRPLHEEGLAEILDLLCRRGVGMRVLGRGTNLLVEDRGIGEAVVDLSLCSRHILVEGERVIAGSGVSIGELLRLCAREGLSGLEGLWGIPGSLGGAIRGNAGSWGFQIGDRVQYLVVYGPSGERRVKGREVLDFAYRKGPLVPGEVVWEIGLRLHRDDPQEVTERMREFGEERKKRQPLGVPCAGCIFRNPPSGPPAGYLIEKAGLKGRRRGGAKVSEIHANFIVNTGGATFSDVMGLIEEVREEVIRAFGVELELEVEVWS